MANPETFSAKCPNCGAALMPGLSGKPLVYTTCSYCKTRVALTRPDKAETAGRIVPEPVPDVEQKKKVTALVLLMGSFIMLAGVGLSVFMLLRRVPDRPVLSRGVTLSEKSRSIHPVICYGDQEMMIDDKTRNLDDAIIMASGRCHLTIKNTRINSSTTALAVSGNAIIRINNSSIIGGGVALAVSGGAVVHVVNTTLKSGDAALAASGNAVVELDRCSIEGDRNAYIQSGNARIILKDTKVIGNRLVPTTSH